MFTVEECRKHLQSWLDADFALATGKSYQMGTQNLTRANAAEVRERIELYSRASPPVDGTSYFLRARPAHRWTAGPRPSARTQVAPSLLRGTLR